MTLIVIIKASIIVVVSVIVIVLTMVRIVALTVIVTINVTTVFATTLLIQSERIIACCISIDGGIPTSCVVVTVEALATEIYMTGVNLYDGEGEYCRRHHPVQCRCYGVSVDGLRLTNAT